MGQGDRFYSILTPLGDMLERVVCPLRRENSQELLRGNDAEGTKRRGTIQVEEVLVTGDEIVHHSSQGARQKLIVLWVSAMHWQVVQRKRYDSPEFHRVEQFIEIC